MWKKIFNLENLVYLTIFTLPVYLLRFRAFGFSTNALDCLFLICIVWWLIFYPKEQDNKLFFKKHKLFIFSVGMMFFGLIASALANKQDVAGAGILISWFLLPMLFSMIAVLTIPADKRKNVFLAYYYSAFFVALISLAYYASGFITYDGRLQGLFNSPNYLAMYLAPAIFIGYGLFSELKKQRGLFFISGVSIFLALYLTFSYAGWLAIFSALGITFIFERKISWKKSLVGLLLFLTLFFLQIGKNKFFDLATLNERSSYSSRVMIWQSAGKILKQNWIWGIGAGNFQTKYLEYQKYFPPYLEWAVPHPHNLYLAFWLYGGIFGLVGFLTLVYFWFLAIVRSQKNPELKFIALGIMFYVLLHGLVDTTYFKNDLAVMFWLLFVLL